MRQTNTRVLSYFKEPSLFVWESDVYFVAGFSDGPAIRLDIVRKNCMEGISWDEMQRIKNECGFREQDALEFYPSEDDVINTGPARHLYIFEERLPLLRRGILK